MGALDMSWGNPKYNTLLRNGDPQKRLDVAIIGDGFTAGQQALFRDCAQQVVDEFNNTEPMLSYRKHFNFHRINLISAESGTDDPYATPPIQRRTALDTFYSPLGALGDQKDRLVGPDPWVMTVATQSGCPWDAIIVLINYKFFGGGVGVAFPSVAYATVADRKRDGSSANFRRLAIHEAGHAIAKLGDEYGDRVSDIDFSAASGLPSLLPWANVDNNGRSPKWGHWLTTDTLPTSTNVSISTIGAFEGALGIPAGFYKPTQKCYMRKHGEPFCPICAEQWVKIIYEKSKISDSFSPQPRLPLTPILVEPDQQIRFKAKVVKGEGIRTSWYTKKFEDASWKRVQRTPSYQDYKTELPDQNAFPFFGTYWQVHVLLEDRSGLIKTPSIKNSVKQRYTWDLISTKPGI
jgi:hypothetical protein